MMMSVICIVALVFNSQRSDREDKSSRVHPAANQTVFIRWLIR